MQFLLIIKFAYNNSVYNTINKMLMKMTRYYTPVMRRRDIEDPLIE